MPFLKPDFIYSGVPFISLKKLEQAGVKGILLDIDNTLIDYTKKLSDEVISWVENAKQAGFQVCILSNTNKKEKIEMVSQRLKISFVAFAKKPFKSGYLRAAKVLKLDCKNIAMVGDQLFTDILGANRVGMVSIYVKPISRKEYWYTKWKRPIEAFFLRKYQKISEKK